MIGLCALVHFDNSVTIARIGAGTAAAFAFRLRTVARECSECEQQDSVPHYGHSVVNGLGMPVCGAWIVSDDRSVTNRRKKPPINTSTAPATTVRLRQV
jgi:hypothetical protein